MTLENIIKLLEEIHKESKFFNSCKLDTSRAKEILAQLVGRDDVFLKQTENGAMLGVLTQPFWSSEVWAQEEFIYVSKEARGSGEGQELISAFEAWAKSKGAAKIIAGDSMGISDKALTSYLKNGYNKHALSVFKEI